MAYPICYELRVLLIATGTSVKCCSLSATVIPSLEVIPGAIFYQDYAGPNVAETETSVQPNKCIFFLGPLICQIRRLLNTGEI